MGDKFFFSPLRKQRCYKSEDHVCICNLLCIAIHYLQKISNHVGLLWNKTSWLSLLFIFQAIVNSCWEICESVCVVDQTPVLMFAISSHKRGSRNSFLAIGQGQTDWKTLICLFSSAFTQQSGPVALYLQIWGHDRGSCFSHCALLALLLAKAPMLFNQLDLVDGLVNRSSHSGENLANLARNIIS